MASSTSTASNNSNRKVTLLPTDFCSTLAVAKGLKLVQTETTGDNGVKYSNTIIQPTIPNVRLTGYVFYLPNPSKVSIKNKIGILVDKSQLESLSASLKNIFESQFIQKEKVGYGLSDFHPDESKMILNVYVTKKSTFKTEITGKSSPFASGSIKSRKEISIADVKRAQQIQINVGLGVYNTEKAAGFNYFLQQMMVMADADPAIVKLIEGTTDAIERTDLAFIEDPEARQAIMDKALSDF